MSGNYNYIPQSDSFRQGYGEAMRQSASASSQYTSYTSDSGYASKPNSSPAMDSPAGFENAGINLDYNYQQYDSLPYQPPATATGQSLPPYSSSYESASHENPQAENSRPTPISLMWDSTQWAIGDFYDIEIPQKESKSKEPYLVLDAKYPATGTTPRQVFLDKSPDASKNYHPCMFPGRKCWKSRAPPVFGRSADLLRHYAHVHAHKQNEILCDYNHCTRAKDPFTRKDHYRDHLRDYHKEDMPRPDKGKKSPKKEERRINPKWWRCSKCLQRKYIKEHGWQCCGLECEKERQRARTGMEGKSEQDYSMKIEVDTSREPFPSCNFCNGQGQTWNGTICTACSPSQVPVYGAQYAPSSYISTNASGSMTWDDATAYPTSSSYDSRSYD